MRVVGRPNEYTTAQDRLNGIGEAAKLSNKGMKLTKLSAAPTLAPQAALRPEVPPHARAAGMDAGTASQLIPGVRRTCARAGTTALAVLTLLASRASGGGDYWSVKVMRFVRQGEATATFVAVPVKGPLAPEGLLNGCAELQVAARYARWKWLVGAPKEVTAKAQAHALDVLEQAAKGGHVIGLGVIGDGWIRPDERDRCRVVSDAFVEETASRRDGVERVVLSYGN